MSKAVKIQDKWENDQITIKASKNPSKKKKVKTKRSK